MTVREAVSEPERRELVALPESRYEVETVADDLPGPDTILLGSRATETTFKQLPLSRYRVIHLALHAYVDPEFPDRSALVFAPEEPPRDDGLLTTPTFLAIGASGLTRTRPAVPRRWKYLGWAEHSPSSISRTYLSGWLRIFFIGRSLKTDSIQKASGR